MPAPRKSAPEPKSKASRPEVHPLGEHLAELLNPALVEPKPQGNADAEM
jgi:excinuclease ABC subunit B